MEDENGRPGEENGYDGKKMKETERTIIDRHEEEKEERETRITKLVTERISRTKTGKRQQKEEGERE